jgi:hypothetical protein
MAILTERTIWRSERPRNETWPKREPRLRARQVLLRMWGHVSPRHRPSPRRLWLVLGREDPSWIPKLPVAVVSPAIDGPTQRERTHVTIAGRQGRNVRQTLHRRWSQ